MIKWIKTKDKLPQINQLVLVWWGDKPDVFKWNGKEFQSGCLHIPQENIEFWVEINPPE